MNGETTKLAILLTLAAATSKSSSISLRTTS
jgi:hypothetical protein